VLNETVTQNVTNILGYFIFSNNHNDLPKVAQWDKNCPIWSPWLYPCCIRNESIPGKANKSGRLSTIDLLFPTTKFSTSAVEPTNFFPFSAKQGSPSFKLFWKLNWFYCLKVLGTSSSTIFHMPGNYFLFETFSFLGTHLALVSKLLITISVFLFLSSSRTVFHVRSYHFFLVLRNCFHFLF